MISYIKALYYALFHRETLRLTIVRRYVDAQGHYIGELYVGEGREAKMIGMACDNLPFDAETKKIYSLVNLCYSYSFLDRLPPQTIRVGGTEPKDHSATQEYMKLRRYCKIRVTVLNRFVEYVLEKQHVG